MRKSQITLFMLTAALLLGLTACKQVSPATEPPEPRVTSDGTQDYIIIEPRFTLDTIPEFGNTKTYIDLLYQPREAVEEALSTAMGDEYYYFLPEVETLWNRDFSVMLEFSAFTAEPGEYLRRVSYTYKMPRDMIESETANILSALKEIYGEPDVPDVRVSPPSSLTRWTLEKHHPSSDRPIYSEKMMAPAEGIGVFLEFRDSTLGVLRPEDIDDAKNSRFISLTYTLSLYSPILRYAD